MRFWFYARKHFHTYYYSNSSQSVIYMLVRVGSCCYLCMTFRLLPWPPGWVMPFKLMTYSVHSLSFYSVDTHCETASPTISLGGVDGMQELLWICNHSLPTTSDARLCNLLSLLHLPWLRTQNLRLMSGFMHQCTKLSELAITDRISWHFILRSNFSIFGLLEENYHDTRLRLFQRDVSARLVAVYSSICPFAI